MINKHLPLLLFNIVFFLLSALYIKHKRGNIIDFAMVLISLIWVLWVLPMNGYGSPKIASLIIVCAIIIYTYYISTIVEPFENNDNANESQYQEYPVNNSNANILAQQNAGNIKYIKERIGDIPDIKSDITQLTSDIDNLQQQINALAQQKSDEGHELMGGGDEPADITGI